jgi:hypothetical protein
MILAALPQLVAVFLRRPHKIIDLVVLPGVIEIIPVNAGRSGDVSSKGHICSYRKEAIGP